MSNKPEINPDDVNSDHRSLVVLQTVNQHHALIKVNRFLVVLVFALMAAVFVLGLVLLPRQNRFEAMQANQTVAAYAMQNPAISAEINALKGQMFGLVSGSIESKLRSLEDNIKRGSVADSLNTIQDLKSDVKVLSSYTGGVEIKNQEVVANQQIVQELTDLKDLVYLTFISCGLMIAALAGVWFRHRYRLTHHQTPRAYLGRKD